MFATITESPVTVSGVHTAVDTCLARGPRFDIARGFSGLVTSSYVQSSANQRVGRTGREGSGIVVRYTPQSEFASFPARLAPEIEITGPTQALLNAATRDTPGVQGLKLLSTPPSHHAEAVNHILAGLGAVDEAGSVTKLGHILATLSVHPRTGHVLLTIMAVMSRHTDATARMVKKPTDVRDLAKQAHRIELETETPVNPLPSDIPALVIALA